MDAKLLAKAIDSVAGAKAVYTKDTIAADAILASLAVDTNGATTRAHAVDTVLQASTIDARVPFAPDAVTAGAIGVGAVHSTAVGDRNGTMDAL
jgi:hypothetical protein